MMHATDVLSIGDLARRTGLSVSAIRFYEARGLIAPFRSAGNQRRYLRSDIRRLSFIRIAQQLGLPLHDIAAELAKLPHGRAPNAQDWRKIATAMRGLIDARLSELARTRDRLDGCIGCGCLSLTKCALYNRQDHVAARGPGPRLVLDS